jgi:FkbM family methyltransferase
MGIEQRVVSSWRSYIRALRTDSGDVGVIERCARTLLVVVPFFAVVWPLRLRAALRGPLTVTARTDDDVVFRCHLPEFVQMYVYLFGTWEPDLAAFLRRRLRPGDTFIDVGANVGTVCALASRAVGPKGTVVAVEPSPPVLTDLRETVAANRLGNVRVIAAAASDREQELELFAPSYNLGVTTTVARPGLQEQGVVRAAPLPALVGPEILAAARLVKIDVEGAEDRVLTGLLDSVDAMSPQAELIVELSPSWWSDTALRPIDVLGPYLDRGFHVYLLPNDYSSWRYLWPNDVSAPRRLRDLATLRTRPARLDVVLSRIDADSL